MGWRAYRAVAAETQKNIILGMNHFIFTCRFRNIFSW